MGPQPTEHKPRGPQPREPQPREPWPRKLQPKDISLLESLAIVFYEALFILKSPEFHKLTGKFSEL